jgi:hypothetical protein
VAACSSSAGLAETRETGVLKRVAAGRVAEAALTNDTRQIEEAIWLTSLAPGSAPCPGGVLTGRVTKWCGALIEVLDATA